MSSVMNHYRIRSDTGCFTESKSPVATS
uniref:Uncharacterized protein n=1 Tax=Amphimedon queenslandica TaxID=400682 RepID=A0A1X7SUC9_AMPQE